MDLPQPAHVALTLPARTVAGDRQRYNAVVSTPSSAKPSAARQRLVETAGKLFYAEGIRAVGIDRIIAEADVAKKTLYNHFASKDELILAVLEDREQQVLTMLTTSIERHVQQGQDRLDAFFLALREWFQSAEFRGCAFINASVEMADPQHPASQFAAAHKQRLYALLREMIAESAGPQAARQAPAICLLVEGAMVAAVLEQSSEPAKVAHVAARQLISSGSPKNK